MTNRCWFPVFFSAQSVKRWKNSQITRKKRQKLVRTNFCALLFLLVRGRRQAHNPTLAKILRLTYNRSCSHNRPQTAACNAVYSISRRALLITRLGEQLPRPRQVSMTKFCKVSSTYFFFPLSALMGVTLNPAALISGSWGNSLETRSYLLGLLAKIKCSICSYQLNLWYGGHWPPSRLNLFLYRVGDHTIYRAPAQVTSVLHTFAECCW